MTSANEHDRQPEGINKRRLVVSLLVLPLYSGLFMFLPAGTWAWAKGWLFIGVFLGTAITYNPGGFEDTSRSSPQHFSA